MTLLKDKGNRFAGNVAAYLPMSKSGLDEGSVFSGVVFVENNDRSREEPCLAELKDGLGRRVEVAVHMNERGPFRIDVEELRDGVSEETIVEKNPLWWKWEVLGSTTEIKMTYLEVEPVFMKTPERIESVEDYFRSCGLAEVVEGAAFVDAELCVKAFDLHMGKREGNVIGPVGKGLQC